MKDHKKIFDKKYKHPDVYISADEKYNPWVHWLFDLIEEKVGEGIHLRPGEILQMGWTSLIVMERKGDGLALFEPEFGSFPVRWKKGINNSVRDLIIQNEVCEQFAVLPEYPCMRQSVVVSPNFTISSKGFQLSRDLHSGNDSGWVFREADYLGSNGALSSLYQIAIAIPAVIPFLALPSGAAVEFDFKSLHVFVGNIQIDSKENRYFDNLLRSSYFHQI